MVERQPSKLRVAGSNPVSRSIKGRDRLQVTSNKWAADLLLINLITEVSAHVAQSAEHILGKDEVTGSIPVMGSM